jgi:phenylalanyl-tRNA synthetase alpha chain
MCAWRKARFLFLRQGTNMTELSELESQLIAAVDAAGDEAALDEVRVSALGKKGTISERMKTLGKMDPEERKAAGQALNALKDKVADAIAARATALKDAALDARLASEFDDVTLPVRPELQGSVHPVSQVWEEVVQIFGDMGFAVAEGPHIETDWYNFDALNIPEDHPARQEHDTFYFNPRRRRQSRMVLRTHTSPVQIRTMEAHGTPIRIIAPGRALPLPIRPDPHADVPPGRGSGDRRKTSPGPPEMVPGGVLQGVLRG